MAKVLGFIIVAAGVIAIVVGISAGMGWIFQQLYNCIATNFGMKEISFKVAWAIWVFIGLVAMLFRSTSK